jgi:hypothetical protein
MLRRLIVALLSAVLIGGCSTSVSDRSASSLMRWQDRQRQAQIYEELLRDSRGQFATSCLARAEDVKDNRLRRCRSVYHATRTAAWSR